MKIIKKDFRHNRLVLKPEVLDDLRIAEKIIDKGDFISGKTFRSITMQRGDVNVKTGRHPVFLKIAAESMEYNEQELRVKGRIVEGPDDISRGYHTFEIKPDCLVTIEKPNGWKRWQIANLENATIKPTKILVCVLDEREADFASITNKIDVLTTIRGPAGKSYEGHEEDKKKYYNEVVSFIKDKIAAGVYEKIIIAGPGFAKDNLMEIIKEKEKDISGVVMKDSISHTGIAGMRELINRGMIDRISKDNEMSKQTQLIDGFFTELSRDGLVAYGLNECRNAITAGNAKLLMISDDKVRQNELLLDEAEKVGAAVHIIDTHHEAGHRFSMFGGIAVFLRYKI